MMHLVFLFMILGFDYSILQNKEEVFYVPYNGFNLMPNKTYMKYILLGKVNTQLGILF